MAPPRTPRWPASATTASTPRCTPYVDATGPFDPERGLRFEVRIVHPDTPELTRLLTALDRGELTSTVERTYPLAEAGAAHRRQRQGGLRGKLVLLP